KENFPRYLSEDRGYTTDILDLGFDLRSCNAGRYRNRLLFPFYDTANQLVTFTARLMDDRPNAIRYLFPEGSQTDQFLYGVHRIQDKLPRLWVVEGQFDVLRMASFGEYAVGVSTSILSSRQQLDIRRLHKLYHCKIGL